MSAKDRPQRPDLSPGGNKMNDWELLVPRPIRLIVEYIRREAKESGEPIESVRVKFANLTGISVQSIKSIENGRIPTSSELEQIEKAGLGLTAFNLLGINPQVYENLKGRFFKEVRISNPSSAENVWFETLYKRCARQRIEDEKKEAK